MSERAQKIHPDVEERIRETIKTNKEVIRQLQLVNQSLSAQLPGTNKGSVEDKGYFVDPKYGKKLWYDLKAKARYEKSMRHLKVAGEK